MLTQNKILAEHNLNMEPRLKDGVARLHKTHSEVTKIKDCVDTLKVQLDSISESRSLDTVSVLLQASVRQIEDESDVSIHIRLILFLT